MNRSLTTPKEQPSTSSQHETFELPFPKLSPMDLSNITSPSSVCTPLPTHATDFPFPHVNSGFPLPSLRSISPPSRSVSLPSLKSILTPPLPTAAAPPQLSPSPQPSEQTPTAVTPCCHYEEDESTNNIFAQFIQPLTLAERRQRNKTASAKYRAKKQNQTHEMRNMIRDLTEQNGLLTKQLEESRRENAQLRRVCDQLRAQIVADSVFKKYLGNEIDDLEDLDEMTGLENKRSKRECSNLNLRKV